MTWAEVDLTLVRQNALAIKSYVDDRKLIAVIKSDAYGHGLVPVARALRPVADILAVATVNEAVELRNNQIEAPIMILYSSLPQDVSAIIEHDLQPTVSDPEFCKKLFQLAVEKRQIVRTHVNIDTGMNRDGVWHQKATSFIDWLSSLPQIEVASIFTHFATTDVNKSSRMHKQLDRFKIVVSELRQQNILPPTVHVASTAALLSPFSTVETDFNAVRVGLGLYGVLPVMTKQMPFPLSPALTWKASVISVRNVKAGESVSYGSDYKANIDQKLATLRVGYGDGYPRQLSNNGQIMIKNKLYPIVGQVCMDVTICSLDLHNTVSVGDTAILIGQEMATNLPVNQLANRAGTIPYEILSQINKRVPRLYNTS